MKPIQQNKKDLQLDDMEYLSSLAFEQFGSSENEIEQINKKIDSKINYSSGNYYSLFISGVIGLFIGISIFFVIFHKNKNHKSFPNSILEPKSQLSLHNAIIKSDTVFPEIQKTQIITVKEHFNSIANNEEDLQLMESPELLEPKTAELITTDNNESKDIIFEFIPNAPVVFINNLKVTNYKSYYFKQSNAINLAINTGLSAQYENHKDVENTTLSKSNSYLAHKIIQNAMYLFNAKKTSNCIEELNLLYNYNSNDANAQFYLGMCYFQTGKYNYSINYFSKNIENENNIFHQESEYYQALCFINLNEIEKGKQQLNAIIKNKGFYSKRAQESLKKIDL